MRKPSDDAYVKDLAAVVRDVAPLMLDMLHRADGYCELSFNNGKLYLITDSESRRLLP